MDMESMVQVNMAAQEVKGNDNVTRIKCNGTLGCKRFPSCSHRINPYIGQDTKSTKRRFNFTVNYLLTIN